MKKYPKETKWTIEADETTLFEYWIVHILLYYGVILRNPWSYYALYTLIQQFSFVQLWLIDTDC